MRSSSNALDRARADIETGRLWKARDRLMAAFRHNPTDQQTLDLLGEVYAEMGDLPSAGRFWILTDRHDDAITSALAAFEQRWGGNLGEKLKVVPLREPIDHYPPHARDRLRILQEEARQAGIEWPGRTNPSLSREVENNDELQARDLAITALLAVLGPGLWLLGIVTAVYLAIRWLT